jgi:hypothetical protein
LLHCLLDGRMQMFVVGGNIIISKAQSTCTAFCVWLSNSPQIPIMMIQNTRFLGDQHESMMV